jgi:hypothetical protein
MNHADKYTIVPDLCTRFAIVVCQSNAIVDESNGILYAREHLKEMVIINSNFFHFSVYSHTSSGGKQRSSQDFTTRMWWPFME